jgi:LPXTG-motif cell wall-anchored protein
MGYQYGMTVTIPEGTLKKVQSADWILGSFFRRGLMFRKVLVALFASFLIFGAIAMPGAAQVATPAATPVVTPTAGATEAPSKDHHHHKSGEKAAPAASLPNTGAGDTTDPSIAIGFAVIAAGVLAGAGIFVRQRRRDLTL